jgi:DNA-binding MarR family transcriptional regulator
MTTKTDDKAARIVTLLFEVAQTFMRLRAVGQSLGVVAPWGGGIWGFLRSLKEGGPQTVPQLARARPVARQRIQRIADEAAAAGYIEFIDNPRHKRSKLIRLTPEGEAVYAEMNALLLRIAGEIGADLDPADIDTATDLLRTLRERAGELTEKSG